MQASRTISSHPGERQLKDLISVGPAMLRDFEILGIHSVPELARANPRQMYNRLCEITGEKQDICCLDVFRAAAQGDGAVHGDEGDQFVLGGHEFETLFAGGGVVAGVVADFVEVEIAAHHEVHPNQVTAWKTQVLELLDTFAQRHREYELLRLLVEEE